MTRLFLAPFSNWLEIAQTVLVGVAIYVALVVLLRLTGSRSLSSLNAFDFVVTVALGAILGSALTADDVGFVQAFVAFGLLLGLQFLVGTIQVEFPWFKRLVTNPPHLLYHGDEFLDEAMDEQRITAGDVRAAARKQGYGSMDDVEAVVLETSGELSVIERVGDGSALQETTVHGDEAISSSDEEGSDDAGSDATENDEDGKSAGRNDEAEERSDSAG